MGSRVLIVLLWFSIMHYSSLFQYFLSIYCPRSSWNFLIFKYTSLLTFLQIIILMNPCILYHKVVMVPQASIIPESEVSITVLCLPCSLHYTVVRIKNCSKCTPLIKVATMKIRWCCVPQLSSETEVSISLLCQLFSTCYTAVRIKNCLKSTSVIKVATMKNTDGFLLHKGSHHVQPPN